MVSGRRPSASGRRATGNQPTTNTFNPVVEYVVSTRTTSIFIGAVQITHNNWGHTFYYLPNEEQCLLVRLLRLVGPTSPVSEASDESTTGAVQAAALHVPSRPLVHMVTAGTVFPFFQLVRNPARLIFTTLQSGHMPRTEGTHSV